MKKGLRIMLMSIFGFFAMLGLAIIIPQIIFFVVVLIIVGVLLKKLSNEL